MRVSLSACDRSRATACISLASAQHPQQLPGITVTAPKQGKAAAAPEAPGRGGTDRGVRDRPPTRPISPPCQSLDPRAGDVGIAQSASQGGRNAGPTAGPAGYRTGELTRGGARADRHAAQRRGQGQPVFLRGFNLDHGTDLAITIDGMPVNMRTHGHGQGYADTNFMIPEIMRGLTYRKGPYIAAEGDFASAGAIYLDIVDASKRTSRRSRSAVSGTAAPSPACRPPSA